MRALIASIALFAPAAATAWGWDNNLTRQCASTTGRPAHSTVTISESNNHYSIRNQCLDSPVDARPTKHWQIGAQTENAETPGFIQGNTCVTGAPNSRTELINGSSSPYRLSWLPHTSDVGPNWTVNMKVDRVTYPPPASCPGTVYSWFAFQDNSGGEGGGPLPSPTTVESSHVLNYATYTPTVSDGARLIASATFFWRSRRPDGTQTESVPRTIEINLNSKNINYQTYYPNNPPGLLFTKTQINGAQYITLDGNHWGVKVNEGIDTFVYVPWYSIVQQTIALGWLNGPDSISQAATATISLQIEVQNRGIANLHHTNFRIGGQ